jgi:anti-sigma B factor antagonist
MPRMSPALLSGIDIQFEDERADGITVAAVSGELDVHTAPTFTRELNRANGASGRVLLDLCGLSFLDSSGLAAILMLLESTEAAGGRLAIVSSRRSVNRAFEMTRLTDVLGVVPTREQAFTVVEQRLH